MVKDKQQPTTGVSIGNVSGGISGSQIAGRDISQSEPNDFRAIQPDSKNSNKELITLLSDARATLTQVQSELERSPKIPPKAKSGLKRADKNVESVISDLTTHRSLKRSAVKSRLTAAQSNVQEVLNLAQTSLAGVDKLEKSAAPVLHHLASLANSIGSAIPWITKLWTSN
jgi:hypothetical protein